jgi:malate dehydrogenase
MFAAPFLRAQVLDILHAATDICISTDVSEIRSADVCVFAAGLPRTVLVKTRADLLKANLPVMMECAKLLTGFEGVLVTVTNPMDANNFLMQERTGLPRERCIGFGGQLDSARYALALAERGIPAQAWVLGEHGEHQVPLFSTLHKDVPVAVREGILAALRGSSMEVIKGKGGTVFGPAYHIMKLIECITDDRRETIPCSCIPDGEYGITGCSLGVPARIGREGSWRSRNGRWTHGNRRRWRPATAFGQQLVRGARE